VTSCTIPGRRHQADAGLLLCRTHLDEVAEWLHDVELEVERLDARPSMAVVWDDSRGHELASHRAPARLGPIVARDRRHVTLDELTARGGTAGMDSTLSAYGVLHDYAQRVRDGRDLHRSDHPHLTIRTERVLLTRHLDWVAAQPWAVDLWAQLQTLRAQLQQANGTTPPGPLPGRCPRLVGGQECGGELWPVAPKHTSGELVHVPGDEVAQAVQCERNTNHRWEGRHLIRLALILDQQQQETA
jgi:hypothetical protein